MVSPSPVPPVLIWSAALPLANGSNIFSYSSALIPGPVSSISINAISLAYCTLSWIYPFLVNLTALPIKLASICVSRF